MSKYGELMSMAQSVQKSSASADTGSSQQLATPIPETGSSKYMELLGQARQVTGGNGLYYVKNDKSTTFTWKEMAQKGRGGTPSGARARWLDNQQGRQWGSSWAKDYFAQNGMKWDDKMSSNHEGVKDIYDYATKEKEYTSGLLDTMNAQLEALQAELDEAVKHGQDAALPGYILDPLSAQLYGDSKPYEGRSESQIKRDIDRLESQIRYTQVQLGAANTFIDMWDDSKAGDKAYRESGLSREEWYQQSKGAVADADQAVKDAQAALEEHKAADAFVQDAAGVWTPRQLTPEEARKRDELGVAVIEAQNRQKQAQQTLRWAEQRRFDELIADPANAARGQANFQVYEQRWQEDKAKGQQAATMTGVGITPDPMAAGMGALMQELVFDKSYLGPDERWTEEQRQLFYSLWNNGTEYEIARAQDYARKVNAFYTNEDNEQLRRKVATSATSGFWAGLGHTAASIPIGLMSGVEFMMDAAELAVRGEVTEKPFGLSDYNQAVQGAVTMALNDKYGDWAGDAYGIATSIAQSWAAMAMTGGTSGLITAMYFGQAAKSEFDRQISMGRSPEKAIAMGVGSGLAEALGEALSIENLKFIMKGQGTNLMLDILRSAAIEGSEEGMTTLINRFADSIVNGDESDYHAALAGYVSQGMSYDEAQRMATKDWLNGLAFDIFAGAISGGVSGGVIAPTVQTVSQMVTPFSGDSRSLVEKAQSFSDTKAETLGNRYADRLDQRGTKDSATQQRLNDQLTYWQGRTEKGAASERRAAQRKVEQIQRRLSAIESGETSRLNVHQANKLSTEITKASNEKNADKIRSSITKQLTAAGLDGETAELAASGIWKSANGKLMTKAESKAMRSNRLGVQLRDELKSVLVEGSVDVERITKDSPQWLQHTEITDTSEELMEAAYPEQMAQVRSILNGAVQQAELVELAEGQGEHSETIQKLFDPTKQTALDYVTAMDTAMNIEAANVSDRAAWEQSESVQYLTQAQRNYAWRQGQKQRNATQEKAKTKQEKIEQKKGESKKTPASRKRASKSGKVRSQAVEIEGKKYKAGDVKKLNRATRRALDRLSAVTGVDIVFFESEAGSDGIFEGVNGYYRDGVVYLDINAGANNIHEKSAVLLTAAHEFVHFIREHSPAQYEILKEFVTERMLADGRAFSAMVRGKMNQIVDGRKLTQDEAVEEVIADACEMVFSDSKSVEALRQKDKGLWNSIVNWMRDFLNDLREAFIGVEARHESAKAMNDYISELAERFGVALLDASENAVYKTETSGTTKFSTRDDGTISPDAEAVELTKDGTPVAMSTGDGTAMFSMKTYAEEGRQAFQNFLEKAVTKGNLTQIEANEMLQSLDDMYEICKEFKDKYAPFSKWSDAEVIRDKNGKPVFSVVTPNGDYKMNLDFSLVCKKRRTLDAVFNEMSKRGLIDQFELGAKSIVKINEIIRKYGFETACALCFVDSKRFRQASVADSFVNLYNNLVYSMIAERDKAMVERFNFSGNQNAKTVENGIHTWKDSDLDFSYLRRVIKENGKDTVEAKTARYLLNHPEGRRLLQRGDFMSSAGFDAVKIRNKDILSLYNSKKGTGGPKAAFGDVQYLNEILAKARWWTPGKAYKVGGVRIQSFSDYLPRMVFDYVQMIYDLSAAKLPAHAYTKEAQFVLQFGLTGAKINMSLIPAVVEDGVAAGLDAKGNYAWAGESFDYDTAIQIQNAEGYTDNCGTICVGVSDEHILKLLDDDNIRMVIPYHKSSLNPVVAHMNNIAGFTDYTNSQRTKKADGKSVEKDYDFNEALHNMGEKGSGKAAADKYLAWCDRHGYTPKFSQFRNHPNYYKLLIDFSVTNKDGQYTPQREVRPVFPTDANAFGSMKTLIDQALEEDAIIEGARDERLSAIIDEIQKALPKTEAEISEDVVQQADTDVESKLIEIKRGKASFSTRDSEGNTLSEGQQRYFAESKVRDENGNLLVMYHGTANYGHTVFDAYGHGKYGLFGLGNYFTDDRAVAESYMQKGRTRPGKEPGVYEVYLNVTNPIDMDAQADPAAWKRAYPEAEYPEAGTNEAFFRALEDDMRDQGLAAWEAADTAIDVMRDMGYDGITHIGGGRFNKADTNRHRVYITFESEQSKRTDNKNPTDHPDIRFSTRDSSEGLTKEEAREQARAYTKLKARAAELEKQVKELKRELSENPGKRVEPKDVAALAKELIRQYASNADTERVEAMIQELGDQFVGDSTFDYDGMIDLAQEIAYTILSESVAYEDTRQQLREPDRIRDKIRTLDIQVSKELLAQMPEGFRKRYSGKLHLVVGKNEGASIRGAYSFLQQEFGTQLFPDMSTDAERLSMIAEMYDRAVAKPTAYNPYAAHMNESINHLGLDIVNAVLTEQLEKSPPSAMETVTTELQKTKDALEKQKKESSARILEIRAEEAAKRKQLREELTAEKWKKVKAVRAYFLEKESLAASKRKESAAQRKYRARVYEKADTLMRWITVNSQKEHVPEAIKAPLAEFLSSINFDSKQLIKKGKQTQRDVKYTEMLRRLADVLDNQAKYQRGEGEQGAADGFVDLPAEFTGDIRQYAAMLEEHLKAGNEMDLSDPVSTMTAEQLEDLSYILTVLETSIRNINRLHTESHFAGVEEAARSTMRELDELGRAKDKGKLTGLAGDVLAWKNSTPYYVFKRFGVAGMERFNTVVNGWAKMAMNIKAVQDFAERAYTGEEAKRWEATVKTIQLDSGRKIRMSVAQIMGLYCLSKREQGQKHIYAGGIRIADFESSKGQTVHQVESAQLTANDVARIVGLLSNRQVSVADKLQKYMSTQCAEWFNNVSMERFGYRQANEDFYYPIDTDPNSRPLNDPKARETDIFRLLNMGATKQLNPNANNAAVIHSIFDVFAAHSADAAKYDALALPLLDMLKWYNYKDRSYVEIEDTASGETVSRPKDNSVQQAIEMAFGKQAQSYFTTFIKDLNGVREGGRNEQVLKGLMGKYKAAAVGANIRVALQQPTAIARAAYLLNPKYLMQGAAMTGGIQEAMKYSGLAVWKDMGYFDVNIARGMREQIKHTETVGDRIRENGMKLAECGDKITWGAIWNACKLETQEKTGLKGEELKQATAQRFNEVIISTQVMDSTITRSELMRGNSLAMNEVTSFMSEPTVTYNVMMDALSQYNLEKRRSGSAAKAFNKTGKVMFRAAACYVVNSALTAAAAAIADAMRDDDEYETFMDKWLEHFRENFVDGMNPLNLLPMAGDVWDMAVNFVQSGKVSAPTSMMWEPFVNVGKGMSSAWDAYQLLLDPEAGVREPNRTQWGRLYNVLQGLSSITGLPAAGFIREVKALWNVSGAVITGKTLKFYDIGAKSSIRNALQEGKLTEEEAIQELLNSGEYEDGNDAYWQVQTWLNAETEGWTKYTELYAAIEAGDKKAWEAAADELVAHGENLHDLRNKTVTQVGRLVCEGEKPKLTRAQAKKILMEIGGLTQMEADHQWDEWQMKLTTGIYLRDLQDEFVLGNVSESRAVEYLIKYDHQRKLDAAAKVQEWKMEKETGIPYSRLRDAYLHGEIDRAKLVQYIQRYGGKSAAEAEEKALEMDAAIKYGVQMGSSEYGILDAYLEGYVTRNVAKEIMIFYDGKTEEEAEEYMSQYDFEKETGYAWKSGDGVQTAYQNGEIDWQEGVEWFRVASPSTHGSPEVAEELMQVVDWKINVPGSEKMNRDGVQKWNRYSYHLTNRGMGKSDFAFAWTLYMNSESQYDANGVKVKEKAEVFFDKLYQLYVSGEYTFDEINGLSRVIYGRKYITKYRKW